MRDEIEKSSPNKFNAVDDGRTRLIVQAGRIEIFRRPLQRNPLFFPLQVRSAGRGRFHPGEYDGQKTHDYVKVIWCCSGSGVVNPGGKPEILSKDQAIVYLPGQMHLSYAEKDEWEICFMTIDGENGAPFLEGFGLADGGIFNAGPAPETTFSSLLKALKDVSPTGSRRASVIAYDILSRIRNNYAAPYTDSLVSEAVAIFDREWPDADIGIDVVALRLGAHRSSLSRRFHQAVGTTPSDYLNSLRMQHALTMIEYTREPIIEIAHSCGYQDPSYFSRLFRRVNGVTARQHRESFQTNSVS